MADWDERTLTTAVATFAQEASVPGLSAAVVTPRRQVVCHAGVTGRDGERVTDQAAFCIASLSKSLTAACLLALRDAGALALDDPLEHHLPEVAELRNWGRWGGDVTLRSLLQHTSGLQCDAPSADLHRWDPVPLGDVLAAPAGVAVVIAPGSAFKYSNLGYELLGEVVARTTGRRYEEAVRAAVLDPLAMDSTWLGPDHRSASVTTSSGHGPLVAGGRDLAGPPVRSDQASGGWWSTASDLASWVHFNLVGGRPDVLTDATLDEMHSPAVSTPGGGGYGFGWRTYRSGAVTTFGHGGLTKGFEARIEIDPAQSMGVVVLVSAVGPDDPAEVLAGQLLGLRPARRPAAVLTPESVPPVRPPAPGHSGLVGTYREVGFEWTISLEESAAGLTLLDDAERWVLTPADRPDRFVVPGGRCAGELLVVLRDQQGAVEAINVAGYPMRPVPRRAEPQPNTH